VDQFSSEAQLIQKVADRMGEKRRPGQWYCYSFHNVASLQAYSTIELALRLRLGKAEDSKSTMRPLLDEALAKGLISEDWMPEGTSCPRNISAHGKFMIHPWLEMILRGTAETINKLFAGALTDHP
jgi:hypothetical protein